MARRKPGKPRPPLNHEGLQSLALSYVGRFATTRARLAAYLHRKLRERGWSGESPADIERIVGRLESLGYVDDAAYALSKSRALTGRGYGVRRVRQSLKSAGIGEQDGAEACSQAEAEAVESALRFARRRRLGPFAEADPDRSAKEKAVAAMVRAGHSFGLARAIAEMAPGSAPDIESLAEKA